MSADLRARGDVDPGLHEVAAHVPASLAAYRTGVARGPGGPGARPLAALREPGVFADTLAAFAARFGPADPRCVVSYWSQHYLALIATPALTALLRLGRPLPLAFDAMRLELDADGRPARLLIDEGDAALGQIGGDAGGGIAPGLAGLVEAHLRPFAEICHRQCGLAPRIVWGNAAVILDHVAGELGARDVPGERAAGACAELAACLGWCAAEPCPRSPLARTLCRTGAGGARRRACCLRHRLPGVPSCGALCPLEPPAAH